MMVVKIKYNRKRKTNKQNRASEQQPVRFLSVKLQ